MLFPPPKIIPAGPIASSSPARASSPRSAPAGGSTPRVFAPDAPAFRPVTLFDVSRQRAKIAAEIDLPDELPPTKLSANTIAPAEPRHADAAAGRPRSVDAERLGPAEILPVVLGTTSGEMSLGEDYFRQAIRSPRAISSSRPTRVAHYQVQQQGARLVRRVWFSRPPHHHFQRLRLRRERHRPCLGNGAAAGARKKF